MRWARVVEWLAVECECEASVQVQVQLQYKDAMRCGAMRCQGLHT